MIGNAADPTTDRADMASDAASVPSVTSVAGADRSPADDVVAVQIPASSANLGPGFDAFAVALGLHLVAWTTEMTAQRVRCSGEGASELPTDDRNMVWQAFTAFCRHAGATVPDVSIVTRNAIPLERGLGSSAAAAVAGVVLARALTGVAVADQVLVDLVTEVEGHADNAAAAVMGGLVVTEGGKARRLEPSRSLVPVVFVPTTRQSTTASRARLPAAVSLAAAAANGARAALVLAGLAGTVAWDPTVLHDVLHEPARLAAMPATADLVARLRSAGIGACLSGSGPTVLAIVPASGAGSLWGAGSLSGTGSLLAGDGRLRQLAGTDWDVRVPGWDAAGAVTCAPPGTVARE